METATIKSFRFTADSIELCEDAEGKEIAVSIPKWMFNQMVEHCFNVKVNA